MAKKEVKYNYFIYLIESPSDDDLYNKVSEGSIITDVAKLNAVNCIVKTVPSIKTFKRALSTGIANAIMSNKGYWPIVHISAHGFKEGIQLMNGELINWYELRDILIPINKVLGGYLLLCMSSCKGFNACVMVMRKDDTELPFYGMVGSTESPTWSETAVGYATFYHQLKIGKSVPEAVIAMQTSSGNSDFLLISAERAKNMYIDKLSKINLTTFLKNLKE